MTPERWRRVEDILHAALMRADSERAAFLVRSCAGDDELRRRWSRCSLSKVRRRASSSAGGGRCGSIVAMPQPHCSQDDASRRLPLHERIGVGAWGRSIAHATRSWARCGDQDLCRSSSRAIPIGWRDSNARHACSRRSIILTLAPYGLEDADGVRALVLELIGGETLAERIARGPMPLTETLMVARQMADALEAAHEKGIVHRDLKPANIKITSDGVVKVLDFGLAKGSDDMPSADVTREGVILGTAAYMSPEQARGRPADKRSDIWAFGVVLYEMLTGRPAFEGETLSDLLAKVIERDPEWTALPASTPLRLGELVRRCMRKDPKTRLQAIGDARVQIEELISGTANETAGVVDTHPGRQRPVRGAWIVAALSLAIIAALAIPAALYFRRVVPASLVTRFEIQLRRRAIRCLRAVRRRPASGIVAMSEGTPRIFVRPLDQVTARPSRHRRSQLSVRKPDGRAIGFCADGS